MLGLTFIAEHYAQISAKAAHNQIGHQDYLAQLIRGELDLSHDRALCPKRPKRPLSELQLPHLRPTGDHLPYLNADPVGIPHKAQKFRRNFI